MEIQKSKRAKPKVTIRQTGIMSYEVFVTTIDDIVFGLSFHNFGPPTVSWVLAAFANHPEEFWIEVVAFRHE